MKRLTWRELIDLRPFAGLGDVPVRSVAPRVLIVDDGAGPAPTGSLGRHQRILSRRRTLCPPWR